MRARSWSKGDKLSLVRVIEPKKDAGNGTLLNDSNMWTYTPKINRIIKVPSSMMSQSWMGSDFSNKDIAKSTDIIDQYDHELTAQEEKEGHVFYTITSIPHEDAAVVWGKEVLTVRDDFVLMEQQFWDQDDVLVKTLQTLEVQEMGGRPVARGAGATSPATGAARAARPGRWERCARDLCFRSVERHVGGCRRVCDRVHVRPQKVSKPVGTLRIHIEWSQTPIFSAIHSNRVRFWLGVNSAVPPLWSRRADTPL